KYHNSFLSCQLDSDTITDMLPKGLLKEYSKAISMLTRAVDMFTILLAGTLAYFIRFQDINFAPVYLSALAVGLCLTPLVFSFFNIYASVRSESFLRHIVVLIQAVCALGLLLAGLSFVTRSGSDYSRTWFACWMSLSLVLLILYRCSLLFLLRFMR